MGIAKSDDLERRSRRLQQDLWRAALGGALDLESLPRELPCMALDPHLNFAIQLCVVLGSEAQYRLICRKLTLYVKKIAGHRFGCRTVIRLVEQYRPSEEADVMLKALAPALPSLIHCKYGNRVVQALLTHAPGAPGIPDCLEACVRTPRGGRILTALFHAYRKGLLSERQREHLSQPRLLKAMAADGMMGRRLSKQMQGKPDDHEDPKPPVVLPEVPLYVGAAVYDPCRGWGYVWHSISNVRVLTWTAEERDVNQLVEQGQCSLHMGTRRFEGWTFSLELFLDAREEVKIRGGVSWEAGVRALMKWRRREGQAPPPLLINAVRHDFSQSHLFALPSRIVRMARNTLFIVTVHVGVAP